MTVLTRIYKNEALAELGTVILMNLLLALTSLISFPLPFSPVPIVIQVQACLMLPVVFGGKRAFYAVALLLIEALCGLPVLSSKVIGPAVFMGPTAGYLIGFLASTLLVSFAFNKLKSKTAHAAFIAMSLGNAAIYILGALYLGQFLGLKMALLAGVAPFVFPDIIKLMISSKLIARFGL